MKKRTHTGKKVHGYALSLAGSAVMPRGRARLSPEPMDRPGDGPGLTIVPGPQFDALLGMLDNPPEVSEELRREVAKRRWR